MIFNLLGQVALVFLGVAAGYFVRQSVASRRANSIEERLRVQAEAARAEAKEIVINAKATAAETLTRAQDEERDRKAQLNRFEERLLKMQENLERELREVASREGAVRTGTERVAVLTAEAEKIRASVSATLEKIAGMSSHEAREKLFAQVAEGAKADLAFSMQKLERERRDEIEKRGVEIMTTSLQRYARAHVTELSTSTFVLPSEDLKGKIIGREGRNIRTLERLTGVEIVIDEHPEAITISSFDPMRRELARMTLEKLIKDGRIQPAKIEEKVEESRAELAKRVQEYGDAAAYELGIVDFPKEVLQVLGRLHFRTSYGQNVLNHSIEMAHIAGMLATELGLRVDIAKKGALVHDIGKAIDHEVQGTHVDIGRKILKKYGVDEDVIRAMEAHHDEYPHAIPEAFIVTTADAISGARPGARRDSLEHYFKRLADLEKIGMSFAGVQTVYALSAGREIRVFVTPEKIDDFAALQLAKDIAHRIQTELRYPGEIKVNVIRELRAVEYAR